MRGQRWRHVERGKLLRDTGTAADGSVGPDLDIENVPTREGRGGVGMD